MSKGISLHIGLNAVDPAQYEGWAGPLTACEADAEDMEAIAKSKGYSTTILKTAAVKRDAVMSSIKKAATDLKQGDIFMITYSGHGGQVRDVDGDEPDDLLDETWCLFDGQLIDDELYSLWATFKEGVRILVLSDSCHSGTVTKMALSQPETAGARAVLSEIGVQGQLRFRAMPNDVALRTYRKHAAFYDSLQPRKGRKGQKNAAAAKETLQDSTRAAVRLISGCQDNQLSLDGTFNGLFTGMLRLVWDEGAFKGNYKAFHGAIVKRMPPTQTPKHFLVGAYDPAYDRQSPFDI